jgi:hypothetical protein
LAPPISESSNFRKLRAAKFRRAFRPATTLHAAERLRLSTRNLQLWWVTKVGPAPGRAM